MAWADLKNFEGVYQMYTEYPHVIRKKTNVSTLLSEVFDKSTGYFVVFLCKKKYYKHRLIAEQFIENTENCKYVDHINHNRLDNRICNLRWCTAQQNLNNLSCQEFVDKLPKDARIVEEYNDRKFNFLYFSNETDKFYVFNGKNYVVKKEFRDRKGNFSISYSDIDGVNTKISYRKFKELNQIV